ncbi:MAG TPA: helix-turn-helix domain-containing protein [Candidatus Cybelea sp.]|nr:helix-turn-helix domain-containing protein [Candidatus Cybelea sp.]
MRWQELGKEACSVARTVSVIGDRWTLLILRDCFLGIRRFDDFQARLGITRHVLADRLRKLLQAGVLEKRPYQERPKREEYRLTEAGLDLYPILMGLVRWGDRHRAGKRGRPVLHRHKACGNDFEPVLTCSECGEALDPRQVHVHPGPGARSGAHWIVPPERTGRYTGAIKPGRSRA